MEKDTRPRWARRLKPESTEAAEDSEVASGTGERLQKILAQAGVASRRAAEELITAGRVSVNGVVVTELGTRANPATDKIVVNGRPIRAQASGQVQKLVYLALNKPLGVVSTARDEHNRPTVVSLVAGAHLAEQGLRVFPVGRLDADSTGLVLLTNDGDLTFRLTHPRYGVEKEYEVVVRGRAGQEAIRRLREGVEIEGSMTAPARVDEFGRREGNTLLRITIHEGRKRQVRLMCAAVGHPVLELRRTRFGPIKLAELEEGKWRNLAVHEVHALRKAVNLKPAAPGEVAHPRQAATAPNAQQPQPQPAAKPRPQPARGGRSRPNEDERPAHPPRAPRRPAARPAFRSEGQGQRRKTADTGKDFRREDRRPPRPDAAPTDRPTRGRSDSRTASKPRAESSASSRPRRDSDRGGAEFRGPGGRPTRSGGGGARRPARGVRKISR